MTDVPSPNVSELAVAEIERRLQWRAFPTFVFIGILLLLLGVGFWPSIFPPRHVSGLPDDPDVFAAATALRGHVTLPTPELRFESALTGDVMPGARVEPGLDDRLRESEAALAKARPRLRRDPRVRVAQAVLDLARHRYSAAERHYGWVLDRYPNYPEARLGMGITLALAGETERNPLGQRQHFLRAIAQFAAVEPADAEYEEALYDRAVLLERVGRKTEAAAFAREYLARHPALGVERMRAVAGE